MTQFRGMTRRILGIGGQAHEDDLGGGAGVERDYDYEAIMAMMNQQAAPANTRERVNLNERGSITDIPKLGG